VPAFSYVAVDPQGRTRRGVIEAEALRQARAGLRSEGLVPMEITAIGAEIATARPGLIRPRRTRLGSADLVLLTRRFALLLEAGLTVEQCLDALIDQEESEAGRRILASVRGEVLAGHPLAMALEQHPSSFPELYRALVATGEQSGELAKVMSRLAEHLERREAMRQDAGLALLYPGIVAVVALAILVGLLTYVVPQVVEVFERSRQGLPLLTRVLVWSSATLSGNLGWLAIVVMSAGIAARLAYLRPAVRAHWHATLLDAPIVGALARGADTARLASTLGILVESGVPLLQALAAGAKVMQNLTLRVAVEEAARRVREGSNLHRALGGSKAFPAILLHLVASGEASGRLAHMLTQAARQQEAENAARIRLLTGILEPAIIVVMGIVVLLVVLAVLLPIIEMNQLVR
jgi:general secretion pathway protein F